MTAAAINKGGFPAERTQRSVHDAGACVALRALRLAVISTQFIVIHFIHVTPELTQTVAIRTEGKTQQSENRIPPENKVS